MNTYSSLDIGIQIVNYKTKDLLKICIEDILNNLQWSSLRFHIFILDNDSWDNLEDFEKDYNPTYISFYYASKNGGFGYGHNILSQYHNAQYMLLVNPDLTIPNPHTIENLYHYIHTSHSTVWVVGIKTHSNWDHWNKIPLWLTKAGLSICTPINTISEVARVQWSFFIIRKHLFDYLQGFDENFFLYREEEDLQLRCRLAWYTILYNPTLSVQHKWWLNISRWFPFLQSQRYFISKWIGK